MHLEVKHALLPGFGGGDEVPLKQIQEILARIRELELDLLALASDELLLVLFRATAGRLLLLDTLDRAPARAQRARDVLVRDGQQVSFFHAQARVGVGDDRLELLDHILFRSARRARRVGHAWDDR